MEKVKLVQINPKNIEPVFINNFFVGHTNDTFTLVFAQAEPPMMIEKTEVKTIDAIIQAKFIITPEFAEQILTVLSQNVIRFKQTKEALAMTSKSGGMQ